MPVAFQGIHQTALMILRFLSEDRDFGVLLNNKFPMSKFLGLSSYGTYADFLVQVHRIN